MGISRFGGSALLSNRAPNARKWPTYDTQKFPNVTMNRIQILPTKFAFKDNFIVKIWHGSYSGGFRHEAMCEM
jgi:hypothetical protein